MRLLGTALAGLLAASAVWGADSSLPRLRRQGTATQLIVDGRPFLVRGGELGNSTASNPAYLRPFWSRFAELNMNTVLAPVYWELIAPQEGRFDFSTARSAGRGRAREPHAPRAALVRVVEEQHVLLRARVGQA